MKEILIQNGMIADGTGADMYRGDVLVKDGKIDRIAPHIEAPEQFPKEQVIDAEGCVVAPGFLDIHRHGDWLALSNGDDELLARQGITTVVNGNCGLSVAPAGEKYRNEIFPFISSVVGDAPENAAVAASMSGYMDALKNTKRCVNTGMLAGNGTIRASVSGYRTGKLSDEENTQVHAQMEEALSAGVLGISLGLAYAPEFAYSSEDLVRALSPIAGSSIPITVHIRNEGDGLADSVKEMIKVSKELPVHLHISHMKCIGKANWQKQSVEVMRMIREAREDGQQIDFDLYPYTTGSTQLVHLLPPKFQSGGAEDIAERLRDPEVRAEITEALQYPSHEYENIVRLAGFEHIYVGTLHSEKFHPYEGLSIRKIAEQLGEDPYDVLYDILIAEKCTSPMFDTFGCEEDMRMYYEDPYASVISDSIYPSGGKLHPRVYASFPEFLIRFVRETKQFTMEEGIRRMTSLPASVLKIDRGTLKEGAAADITVFRPDQLAAAGNFLHPDRYPTGFRMVMTGGEICVRDDRFLGGTSGKVLTRI